ncbi:MAG: ribonuclease P protein component [Xanthobacteraceae bacterium]
MERLKRRSEFRAVAQAAGARAHASGFVLQARPRGERGPPRVGFTVTKQVGNAVERNRVRRRLRELVRLAPPALLQAGHDYVLIARRAALKVAFEAMLQELGGAIHRVHRAGKTGAVAGAAGELPPHRAGRAHAAKRDSKRHKAPDKPAGQREH